MAFTVIHDIEKGVAALIDAEFGRALGPIAEGESAVDLLEKFAGAHGVDPATIPTSELEARWKEFVSALTGEVATVGGEQVTAGDVVAAPPGQAQAGKDEQPPIDPTAQAESTAPPAPPADSPPAAEAAAPPAGGESAPAEDSKPVTSPKAGYVVCPTCQGWGEVVEGGVAKACPTCGGAGEIPVDQHPEHSAPTA